MAHHYQPDLTERAHFSLPLSLSHTHKQFSNFCLFLSFSEGRIFRLQKLRLKYWKKKSGWKEKLPSFSESFYDASLSRVISLRMKNLWLSAAVSEHYTHIESIKEVVSFLLVFHEKLEVFENLKQKTHVSLFIVCTEQRWKGKRGRGAVNYIWHFAEVLFSSTPTK